MSGTSPNPLHSLILIPSCQQPYEETEAKELAVAATLVYLWNLGFPPRIKFLEDRTVLLYSAGT